jgi:hypothetical protein
MFLNSLSRPGDCTSKALSAGLVAVVTRFFPLKVRRDVFVIRVRSHHTELNHHAPSYFICVYSNYSTPCFYQKFQKVMLRTRSEVRHWTAKLKICLLSLFWFSSLLLSLSLSLSLSLFFLCFFSLYFFSLSLFFFLIFFFFFFFFLFVIESLKAQSAT